MQFPAHFVTLIRSDETHPSIVIKSKVSIWGSQACETVKNKKQLSNIDTSRRWYYILNEAKSLSKCKDY